jgi:hypothetical protein
MDPGATVKIGAAGVAALAAALKKNATLELLSLAGALLVAVAWFAAALRATPWECDAFAANT